MRQAFQRLGETLERVPVGAFLALAFLLRAGFDAALGQRFHQIDEVGYFAPASSWAAHGTVPGLAPPVPALFFGAFYRFLGSSYLWPRLGQAAVGTLTALAIARLASYWSGSKAAGRLALAVAAVYPFFVYYGGMLISETLYTGACAGAFCLLAASLESQTPMPTAAGAGLLLAAAALTRVEGAGAGAAVWAGAAFLCLRGRWSWKAWGAAVLAFALPLLGWALRNRAETGRFALDEHSGITLVHGTILYDVDQRFGTAAAMEEAARQPWYQEIQKRPEDQRQGAYAKAAFAFMREHPGQTLGQWARKFVSFWRFYPRTDNAYYETAVSNPEVGLSRGALVAVSLLFEPWLILLGAAGFWALRKRPQTLPFFFFAAAEAAAHVLVVSMMRYRLPVMPLLIAAACSWLATRERRIRPEPRQAPQPSR